MMNHGRIDKIQKIDYVLNGLNDYLESGLHLKFMPLKNKLIAPSDNFFSVIPNTDDTSSSYYHWEKIITNEAMTLNCMTFFSTDFFNFLKLIDSKIFKKFHISAFLPQSLFCIEKEEVKHLYLDISFEQAIRALTQKYGAIFLQDNQVGTMIIWNNYTEDKTNLMSLELYEHKDVLNPVLALNSKMIKCKIYYNNLLSLLLSESNSNFSNMRLSAPEVF